jgi:hypothetical protein
LCNGFLERVAVGGILVRREQVRPVDLIRAGTDGRIDDVTGVSELPDRCGHGVRGRVTDDLVAVVVHPR